MDEEAGIKVTSADIKSFLSNVGNPFVSNIKNNISVHFLPQDIIFSFSIFDPKKIPRSESPRYAVHGEDSIQELSSHYGVNKPVKTLEGKECSRPALISADVSTDWKTV